MQKHLVRRDAFGLQHGWLPISAKALSEGGDCRPRKLADFPLGVPGIDSPPHYPGSRPCGSFVAIGDDVLPIDFSTRSASWRVLSPAGWCDLDEWLSEAGFPLINERAAVLAYGSNGNPGEIRRFSAGAPVIALKGLLLGAAAVYCATPRRDGQYPAGLAAAQPDRAEVHSLLLLPMDTVAALDAKEGVHDRYYERALIDEGETGVAFVLESGDAWSGALPVYLQGPRRPLAVRDGSLVYVSDVGQQEFQLQPAGDHSLVHGLQMRLSARLPQLTTQPLPLFVYGTLRPGESRWPLVADSIRDVGETGMAGRRLDTGYGYPGLVSDPHETVTGVVLSAHPEAARGLMEALDVIEGHPDLFVRTLSRTTSGSLAWVYRWQGPGA